MTKRCQHNSEFKNLTQFFTTNVTTEKCLSFEDDINAMLRRKLTQIM